MRMWRCNSGTKLDSQPAAACKSTLYLFHFGLEGLELK